MEGKGREGEKITGGVGWGGLRANLGRCLRAQGSKNSTSRFFSLLAFMSMNAVSTPLLSWCFYNVLLLLLLLLFVIFLCLQINSCHVKC
jgi:hypothetical protein